MVHRESSLQRRSLPSEVLDLGGVPVQRSVSAIEVIRSSAKRAVPPPNGSCRHLLKPIRKSHKLGIHEDADAVRLARTRD